MKLNLPDDIKSKDDYDGKMSLGFGDDSISMLRKSLIESQVVGLPRRHI